MTEWVRESERVTARVRESDRFRESERVTERVREREGDREG